ncbi:MAG: phosphoribosylaminoimidazolesuccinocarboxamide synthase [Candidatus Paceibacterota bacterium]
MAHIPADVLKKRPSIRGLRRKHRGKVRDSYFLPGFPDFMLVVVSDRCSVYDFVLNILVPMKGVILNAMSIFWATHVLKGVETDLVAYGAAIDQYLPKHLHGNVDLQMRATVVRILPAPDVEAIVRGYLFGSGLKSYNQTGKVCGQRLPTGLRKAEKLPRDFFTPTNKAIVGHDQDIDAQSVVAKYGQELEQKSLETFAQASQYASERGIIIADTKTEWAIDPATGRLILVDEKFTPDSSRFWPIDGHDKAVESGKDPVSFDKQPLRDCMVRIKNLDPSNPKHLARVDAMRVPEFAANETTQRYRYIFWRLTGMKIERFLREVMDVKVADKRPNIQVIIGSRSDLPQCKAGLDYLSEHADGNLNVASCHRNAKRLRSFLKKLSPDTSHLLCAAGNSAQLPGVSLSWLCEFKLAHIPLIGIGLKGKTPRNDLEAVTAIEGLPGRPVVLNSQREAYFGPEGFLAACKAAVNDEFFPMKFDPKPAEFGLSFKQ